MLYYSHYPSPLGPMTMASDGQALTGLWFDGQKYDRAGLLENASEAELAVFQQTAAWLDRYFEGTDPGPLPPLLLTGSSFRKTVLQILTRIPRGTLMTYGEVGRLAAQRMGKTSMSGQAVGGAVGHNPISILIPCHRVVGASGSLTGYAGGLEKKIALLKLEGIDLAAQKLFIPSDRKEKRQ